jgi:hypothetical protein
MSQINSREVVLLASQTITTSGAGFDTNVPMAWQAAIITVQLQTVTGTSPTFNFFVQAKLTQAAAADVNPNPPTGTAIYDDTIAFSQLTQATNQIVRIITSGPTPGTSSTSGSLAVGQDYLQKDATLTAGNYRIGPMGAMWRI